MESLWFALCEVIHLHEEGALLPPCQCPCWGRLAARLKPHRAAAAAGVGVQLCPEGQRRVFIAVLLTGFSHSHSPSRPVGQSHGKFIGAPVPLGVYVPGQHRMHKKEHLLLPKLWTPALSHRTAGDDTAQVHGGGKQEHGRLSQHLPYPKALLTY